jgi:hypothetical protein
MQRDPVARRNGEGDHYQNTISMMVNLPPPGGGTKGEAVQIAAKPVPMKKPPRLAAFSLVLAERTTVLGQIQGGHMLPHIVSPIAAKQE